LKTKVRKKGYISYITIQKAYKFTLNIYFWYKYRRDYIIKTQRKKKGKDTVNKRNLYHLGVNMQLSAIFSFS